MWPSAYNAQCGYWHCFACDVTQTQPQCIHLQCSSTCGRGVAHRTVRCTIKDTDDVVSDRYCSGRQRPRAQRKCKVKVRLAICTPVAITRRTAPAGASTPGHRARSPAARARVHARSPACRRRRTSWSMTCNCAHMAGTRRPRRPTRAPASWTSVRSTRGRRVRGPVAMRVRVAWASTSAASSAQRSLAASRPTICADIRRSRWRPARARAPIARTSGTWRRGRCAARHAVWGHGSASWSAVSSRR